MPKTMAGSATRLNHGDYLLIPDDGQRHEIIDGEHFVSPAPRLSHQLLLGRLYLALAPWVHERRLGLVVLAPFDAILSDFDVVQPDLIFVRADRRGLIDDWLRGTPDLAVEVLSPSNRRHDEVRKRDLYERFAVPEYWILDPDAATAMVYRLTDDRYDRPDLLSARDGGVLRSPLFPGLELDLAALFADEE